jgi:hypothetical protein
LFFDHHWDGFNQIFELHVVESNILGEFQDREESLPMLFFKGLTATKLDKRPCLFELLNSLKKESYDYILLLILEFLRPLEEKVLEGEVSLLSEGKPFFVLE